MQHLSPEEYRRHKRGKALAIAARFGAEVGEMFEAGPQSRRRASLHVSVEKGVVRLGFNAPRSHKVIDMRECLVLRPEIFALIAPLRECLQAMKKPGVIEGFNITVVEGGLEVNCATKSPLKAPDREALIAFASAYPAVRLCENGARIFGVTPVVNLGGVAVKLPPETFLQASESAQEAMIALVAEHLRGCKNIVDLYSGCGTFSLSLPAQAAYEGSPEMIAALHNAALRAGIAVQASARDLYKYPLTAADLAGFDGAAINPPHNGASPQAKQLAASGVQKIAMVSCNPVTFERDARLLLQGGYRLTRIIPVDQFIWSDHLELVGWFAR